MPSQTNPTAGLLAVFLDALKAEKPALKALWGGWMLFNPVFAFLLKIAGFLWSLIEPIFKAALRLIPLGAIADYLATDPTPPRQSVVDALAANGLLANRPGLVKDAPAPWVDASLPRGSTRIRTLRAAVEFTTGDPTRITIEGPGASALSERLLKALNFPGGL